MGQFACECTATGAGKDQFDYTDLYVAQFTLPDGSVVYVCVEIKISRRLLVNVSLRAIDATCARYTPVDFHTGLRGRRV